MARAPQENRIDRGMPAPSSASDLSVYGAMPLALGAPALAMTLGGAPAQASAPSADAPPPAAVSNNALAEGGSPLAAALAAPVMLADAAAAAMASLAVPLAPPAAATPPEADAKPTSGGDGVGVPPGLQGSTATMPPEMATGSSVPPAASAAPSDAAAQTLAQTPSVDGDAAMLAMGERLAAMEDRLESFVGGIDDQLAGIGGRIESVTGGIDDRVEDIAGGVTGQLADTVAGLSDRLGGIDDRVGEITTGLGGQVAGLTGALDDTLGAIAEIDLGPVGGVDPAGGITTLVGMVSAADAFGLPDIGGATEALTLPIGLGGGDLLGDFSPADVLLAVPDPHDGAFGLLAGLTGDHFG